MTNFGYDTVGGSPVTRYTDVLYAVRFDLAEDGIFTSMGIYLKYNNADHRVKLAIYGNTAGHPGNLLAQTGDIVTPGTPGWALGNLLVSTELAAARYHLAFMLASAHDCYYDAGASNQFFISAAGQDYAFPDPVSVSGHVHENNVYSIYAVYTPKSKGVPLGMTQAAKMLLITNVMGKKVMSRRVM